MARPALTNLSHGQESWDTTVNDNMTKIAGGPFPVYQIATVAALLALTPASYEDCLVVTDDTHELWKSDGTDWRLYGDGNKNNNGARGSLRVATTELTLAGATTTWANAFPAGAPQIGVAGRVTQLITSGDGATGANIGDHGATDPDRYKANLAFTLGGTFTPADATADPRGWSAAARDVVVTAIGGTFSGGKVRLVALYHDLTAPTS